MTTGRVVAVYPGKEYGVVRDEGGHQWRFFEFSTKDTFPLLRQGQRVRFRIAETRKDAIAENLQPLDADEDPECSGSAC